MTDFTITATEKTAKNNKLRRDGKIPVIVYGKNVENIPAVVNKLEFDRLYREAGTSNLIEFRFGDKKFKTLINDIQVDPVTSYPIHVDFLKVNMKEKIHAEIPLEFVGESAAVMNLEGSLITPVDSIEVECLPGDLVSEIKVDISTLATFEDNIKVSDLVVPAGIEVLSDPDEIITFVQEPRSEEELEALETEVVENVEGIEVDHKGEEAPEGEGEAKAEAEENKEKE
ncbi:MAG TPA: 50S ribosomal protein L25 [bacterium]|nr:50S ribosomal protein L25 [bacterium]